MPPSDDSILPLIDRNTPVLDRIRGEGKGGDDVAENIGQLVGEAALNDDDFVEDQLGVFEERFVGTLSESLGVEEDDIDPAFVQSVMSAILDSSANDILKSESLEEMGIVPSTNEDDEDEPEEEDSAQF